MATMRDSLFRCVSHVGAHFFIALMKGDRTMSGEKKTPKTTNNIATGIAMAASIVPLVKPAIEAVRDYADKKIEERKNWSLCRSYILRNIEPRRSKL